MHSPSPSIGNLSPILSPDLLSEAISHFIEESDHEQSPAEAASPPPAPVPSDESEPRPSPVEIAEHGRLFKYIPAGCEARWVEVVRPILLAISQASATGNAGVRAQLIDHLLMLPALCLKRKRGGRRRTVKTLNFRLESYAERLASRSDPTRPVMEIEPNEAFDPSEADPFTAKVARAVLLAKRGFLSRCAKSLLQEGIAEINRDAVDGLRALHPPCNNPIPDKPIESPIIAMDTTELKRLIKSKIARGAAPGPSGWTGELLLPLIADDVCLKGLSALVTDIANDALDPHSRLLLTSSILLGIPKKNLTIRPLALGEVFLKTAATYCYNMDKDHFGRIFKDIQLAVGAQGGSERAVRVTQAAIEFDPSNHIALFADSSNAFNTAERDKMLTSIYGDGLINNLWGVFAFSYSNTSPLRVMQGARVSPGQPRLLTSLPTDL
jgi:hypothetical protein